MLAILRGCRSLVLLSREINNWCREEEDPLRDVDL